MCINKIWLLITAAYYSTEKRVAWWPMKWPLVCHTGSNQGSPLPPKHPFPQCCQINMLARANPTASDKLHTCILSKITCTLTHSTGTLKTSCVHNLVLPWATLSWSTLCGSKFDSLLSAFCPSVMACIRLDSWLWGSSLGGLSIFGSTPKMVHSGSASSSSRTISPMSRTLGSPLSFRPFSFLKYRDRIETR